MHLPWSQGVQSDDKVLSSMQHMENKFVVVTEKMDGENTTLYRDHLHARSIDSRHHPSRNWIKAFHSELSQSIPEGWRLCGENLYARHSIEYDELDSYFYLFSIWNERNECLSWEETLEWANLLGLTTPNVLYQGIWDEKIIQSISVDTTAAEGYVVRLSDGFPYEDFKKCCSKWVRSHHVQTDTHWMYQEIMPNKLKGGG